MPCSVTLSLLFSARPFFYSIYTPFQRKTKDFYFVWRYLHILTEASVRASKSDRARSPNATASTIEEVRFAISLFLFFHCFAFLLFFKCFAHFSTLLSHTTTQLMLNVRRSSRLLFFATSTDQWNELNRYNSLSNCISPTIIPNGFDNESIKS